MISYLKSLTLKQRANGILGLTAVLYCFAFVGQFFLIGNSHLWYLYALFIIFIFAFYTLKKETKLATYVVFYVLHILSYKIELPLFKVPLQFLFYFSLGFLFESNREKYNYKI